MPRPAITDLRNCLRIYYTFPEIGSAQIKELFGIGENKACELKNIARKAQIENEIMVLDKCNVNTETAFKAWGIDIDDVEKRLRKLEKLGLSKEATI